MPKKGKKGKKGKKKGGKKKAKAPANSEDIMKKFLKCYERNCVVTESTMCPLIKSAIHKCAENATVLTQFILEAVVLEKEGDVPVLIEPFLAALRQERYTFIRDMYIWKYPMTYENAATLALLLERPFYPVRKLELLDCLLDPMMAQRLGRAFRQCDVLTTVVLDYNEFGDEGCKHLCRALEGNTTVLSVSLCFCDLGVASGRYLGKMVSTSAVRDLYLDGNDLMCEGAMELIKLCCEQAEYEALQRAEEAKRKLEEAESAKENETKQKRLQYALDSGADSAKASDTDALGTGEKKKKKKKGKKKKAPLQPPRVGPWLYKLHIADNSIDNFAFGEKFASVMCMRLFKSLIMHSDCLEELDLDDNCIGDLAARELLEGLEHRKEEKMGGVKMKTTCRLSSDVFNSIMKMGSGLKKKKKKGKKKKK